MKNKDELAGDANTVKMVEAGKARHNKVQTNIAALVAKYGRGVK